MHWGRQIAYPNGWFPVPMRLIGKRRRRGARSGGYTAWPPGAWAREPRAMGCFHSDTDTTDPNFRSATTLCKFYNALGFSQEVQRAVCVGFLRGFPAEAFAWSLVELIVHLLDPRGAGAVQWGPGGGAPRAAGRWCSHWCRAARGSGPGRSGRGRPVVLGGRDPGANLCPRSTVRGAAVWGPGPARLSGETSAACLEGGLAAHRAPPGGPAAPGRPTAPLIRPATVSPSPSPTRSRRSAMAGRSPSSWVTGPAPPLETALPAAPPAAAGGRSSLCARRVCGPPGRCGPP